MALCGIRPPRKVEVQVLQEQKTCPSIHGHNPNIMRRIGLTGGIGSGKTTVSEIFESLGAAVVDADEISHQITLPGRPATQLIQKQWGDSILTSEGQLDRVELRKIVFADPQQLQRLESILHPAIEQQILQQTAAFKSQDKAYCIIVVPLLIEKNLTHLVDQIVVVDLPIKQQITRVMQRDQVDENHVARILEQQITREQRLQRADHIIDNTCDKQNLRKQIQKLHELFSEND